LLRLVFASGAAVSAIPVDGAGAGDSVAAKPRPLPVVAKHNVISWRTFTFMIVAVVCSLRAAPTMAVYGLASIFLYAVPASGTPQETESMNRFSEAPGQTARSGYACCQLRLCQRAAAS
jgi:hypothetical protein